jgi:hypothetical protein
MGFMLRILGNKGHEQLLYRGKQVFPGVNFIC